MSVGGVDSLHKHIEKFGFHLKLDESGIIRNTVDRRKQQRDQRVDTNENGRRNEVLPFNLNGNILDLVRKKMELLLAKECLAAS